jgi:hypothetical protein
MLRRKRKNIPKPNNCWSQMAKLVPRGIFEVQVTASWNLPEGASTFQKIAIFLVLVCSPGCSDLQRKLKS